MTNVIQAREYLVAHDWNLQTALADFFASGDLPDTEPDEAFNPPTAGGRTLDGQSSTPQAIPTTSRLPPPPSAPKPAGQKKFATLGDLGGSSGHAGDDHGDGDSDSEEDQDLFAGGEKSALAVQNPDDIKRKILAKAKRQVVHSPIHTPQHL